MKKVINQPNAVVEDMIQGVVLAHSGVLTRVPV
jgi:dihydroxyacetone kinase